MTSTMLGEFMGTCILILLGNGVVAGVVLNKSKAGRRRLDRDHHRLGICRHGGSVYRYRLWQ